MNEMASRENGKRNCAACKNGTGSVKAEAEQRRLSSPDGARSSQSSLPAGPRVPLAAMANTGIIDNSKGFKLTPATFSAIVMLVGISVAFYYPLHMIHAEQISHPYLSMFLPAVAMTWIALVIPLFMFLTYTEDYKRLNPLNPVHYFYIARKSYRTMSNNNYKVTVKDM